MGSSKRTTTVRISENLWSALKKYRHDHKEITLSEIIEWSVKRWLDEKYPYTKEGQYE